VPSIEKPREFRNKGGKRKEGLSTSLEEREGPRARSLREEKSFCLLQRKRKREKGGLAFQGKEEDDPGEGSDKEKKFRRGKKKKKKLLIANRS